MIGIQVHPRSPSRREIILRIAFLCLCAALYAWWAAGTPCFLTNGSVDLVLTPPDEVMRLDVPLWIVEHGALPRGDAPELIDNAWGFSYAFTAYGSSLLAVPFMAMAQSLGAPLAGIILAARFSVVATSVATLALLFALSSYFLDTALARFLSVAMVAFLPQYAYFSSYFNCEAFEVLCVVLSTLMVMRGISNHWRPRDCAGLGVALGVTALSYYFGYAIYPAAILAYYWSCIREACREPTEMSPLTRYLGLPLLITAVAFAICGWFFVRNLVLYGDFFGFDALNRCAETHAIPELKPSLRSTFESRGQSPLAVLLNRDLSPSPWLVWTVYSSIGDFGGMAVTLSTGIYHTYLVIVTVGLVASVVRLARATRRGDSGRGSLRGLAVAYLFVLIAVPSIMTVYYTWAVDYQPQGRYVIIAVIAVLWIAAWGYGGYPRLESKATPAQRVQRIVVVGVLVAWLSLFAYVLVGTVVPFTFLGLAS